MDRGHWPWHGATGGFTSGFLGEVKDRALQLLGLGDSHGLKATPWHDSLLYFAYNFLPPETFSLRVYFPPHRPSTRPPNFDFLPVPGMVLGCLHIC